MKLMKNFRMMLKINTTLQTNAFIHLLRKLPLLERMIPVSLYRRTGVKWLFALGGFFKGLFGSFLGNTLLCLLTMSWIPAWIGTEAAPAEMLLLCMVVHSFAPALQSCSIFRAKEEDYVFLNHFMMNPTEYYHYKIAADTLEGVITMLPVLIYLLRNPWFVFLAAAAEVLCTMAGACLYLFLYDRLHNMIKRSIRNIVSYSIMLAAYIAVKLGAFEKIAISAGWCIGLSGGCLMLALFCYRRLLHYKDYKRIAVQFANKEAMITVSVSNGGEEGKDALAGFSWEKNKEFYEKNVTADAATYLNRAFFERFKAIFSNQRKQIFLLSVILGIVLGVVIRNDVLKVTGETILNYTPWLIVLVNSIMLFGQRFTTLCFRFVDMPLMYHQVCDSKYLKKSIRCRYVFLVKHSLVALTGLAIFIGLVLVIGDLRVPAWNIVFLLVSMELFMLIQELYQLLIYYWLQPYTVDVSVKSPVFKVLGWIEGLFDISVLFIRGNLALACVPLLGLFLLVNVLMLVMQKNVHKTFRLR